MPLSLYVDGPRWRDHLTATKVAHPGLVPVVKGNGYGLGVGRLARRAEWLGVRTIAVGTYREVREVERRFSGDIMVLEPWRPFFADVPYSQRIIHTVGRASDLAQLAGQAERPRVVLEALTSMRRHGVAPAELPELSEHAVTGRAAGVRFEGHALHLPLGSGHVPEVEQWLSAAPVRRWFISHLAASELAQLQDRHPELEFRSRIGTALWLGDRSFLSPRATVIDVHSVRRGDRVGYRQRTVGRDGFLLVVAGGTAHGIALEAPAAAASPRQRAVSLARGGLDAAGRALSPYVVNGKSRWFIEPPHMQVSLLFLPAGSTVPDIGTEIVVRVRLTTTHFDRVVVS